MAIHPHFPGLRAEVLVNGSALREYNDANENGNNPDTTTIGRYVEAVSNANFEVRVTFKQEELAKKHGVRISVLVDGIQAQATVYRRSHIRSQVVETYRGVHSRINGQAAEAAFRFSGLVMTEDDNSLYREMAASLGKIEVQLQFVKNIREESSPVDFKRALRSDDTIPAKIATLEALSHVTREDEPKQIKMKWLTCNYVDKKPFAKFIFKYRSNESLKHLCIIPRTPEPVLMPSEQEQVQSTAPNPPQDDGSAKLSIEEIKVLLNHYTGKKSIWDGFDRAALEALLNHHKASRLIAANPNQQIKNGCNKTSSGVPKRGREEVRAMDQGAAADVLETGARPVKRRCLPKEGDDIIAID